MATTAAAATTTKAADNKIVNDLKRIGEMVTKDSDEYIRARAIVKALAEKILRDNPKDKTDLDEWVDKNTHAMINVVHDGILHGGGSTSALPPPNPDGDAATPVLPPQDPDGEDDGDYDYNDDDLNLMIDVSRAREQAKLDSETRPDATQSKT